MSVEISASASHSFSAAGLLLLARDDLDLLLVELLVEGVELTGVEIELVERERQLVRVEPACRPTGLEQGTRLVGVGDAVYRRRARAPRISCAQDRPLSVA